MLPFMPLPSGRYFYIESFTYFHTARASPGIDMAIFQGKLNSSTVFFYMPSLDKTKHLTPPVYLRPCGHFVFRRYFWSQFSCNIGTSAMIRHNASLQLFLAFLKYLSRTMLPPFPWMEPRRRFLWHMTFKLVNDLWTTWQQRQCRQRMHNKTFSCVQTTSKLCA